MFGPIGNFFGLGNNLLSRAVNEIRRCAPVILHEDDKYLLVFASELLEEPSLAVFKSFSDNVYILLTAQRASYVTTNDKLSRVGANSLSLADIRTLLSGLPEEARSVPVEESLSPLDSLAIDLVKMAKLLPSALVIDMGFGNIEEMYDWCKCNGILHLAGKALTDYTQEYVLQEVCRSDLYLQDSLKSKIIVYRSKIGEPEHYAIVIGEPAIENIVVRLHSSCYTGDLLGSLSCDCRSQLLTAVKLLAEQAGGIILYISQEGRGIGLANKIRAYSLQMQNSLDTVDANRFLGFDDDERIFLPAAMILRNLGVSSLQLLTNNPHKVQEIGKYGFDVTKTIPFHMEINEYNGNYIKTKQTRLGHTN
ncbi:GTP cyclohydrolase [Anaplasma phagocytophilum str. Norway variant2]|uniref:GTP cyclohydrolase II n=2 Tax=Anaplasma phagocytophilum TaxID=948 RepID=A0A168HPI7_ANAPH|nr:GTP cyclohydrolase [Anaplasma phagocytophilum str. Norway variant2]